MPLTRRFAMFGAATLLLSACVGGGGSFKTEYDPLSPEVSRGWRLAAAALHCSHQATA